MKPIIIMILSFAFCIAQSQTIIGTWQTTRETNCMEQEIDSIKTDADMLKELSTKSSYSPRVVSFFTDNTYEERVKTMEKKKSSVKKFHFKRDGDSLYILDKKSRLIVSNLTIEKITSDSLVYYVAGRECEKKFFVRVK